MSTDVLIAGGRAFRDGVAAAHARQFDVARGLFEQAAAETPDNAQIWFWMAIASPTPQAAMQCLRRVLQLDASHAQARDGLARLLTAQAMGVTESDPAQARTLLAEASGLAPELGAVWIALAEVSADSGERVKALRQAVRLEPHQTELKKKLHEAVLHEAVALAKDANVAEARKLFQEATTTDPNDPRPWQGLARLAATTADAVAALRALVRVAPDSAAAKEALAKAEEAEARARRAARPPRPVEAAAKSRRTIMVVDDSPTIRKILGLTLEGAGYAVVAEPDGERAMQRLAELVPDLILLDITMPKLDGYEVCKRIKKDPRTAHVPVVMLSGKDGFFDKVKGRMVGATEYLTKPFQAPAVLAVIASHCQASSEVAHG
jgi:twitching motility two-component system response regulator PilG